MEKKIPHGEFKKRDRKQPQTYNYRKVYSEDTLIQKQHFLSLLDTTNGSEQITSHHDSSNPYASVRATYVLKQ